MRAQALLFFTHIASLQMILPALTTMKIEPELKTILAGETLNATCTINKQILYCTWKKADINLFVYGVKILPEEIEYDGQRFEIGKCGITILHVTEKHNGNLTCCLFPKNIEYGKECGNLTLVVAKAPRAPQITVTGEDMVNHKHFEEDQTIRAECKIEMGRPEASVSWFIGTDPIQEGLIRPVVESVGPEGEGWKTIRQNLKRKLAYSDNGKELRCVARHVAFEEGTLHSPIYKLNVYFKPKFGVTGQYAFRIGDPGEIKVPIHANPKPTTEWLVDAEKIQEGASDIAGRLYAITVAPGEQGTWDAVLYITEVRSDDAKKSYTLTASNLCGRNEYRTGITTFSEISDGISDDINGCPSPSPDLPACPKSPANVTACSIVGIVIAIFIVILVPIILIYCISRRRWRSFIEVPKITYWSNEEVVDAEIEK